MKRGKRGKKLRYKPWVCDECKSDKSGISCVRPAQCEVAQEHMRARADFLLDQAKEGSL